MTAAVTPAAPGTGRFRKRSMPYFAMVCAALGVAVAVLILYPLIAVLPQVFLDDGSLDLSAWRSAWSATGTVSMLRNTAILVGAGTVLAVVIGSVFAWFSERTDASMGRLTEVLPIVPMMVPPLAGTIGWVLLLTPGPGLLNVLLRDVMAWLGGEPGLQGPLNIFSWYGLIFIYVLYMVPHVFLTVAAALRNLDPALEEASRASGARPWTTLVRITLPAIRPSITAGALLALVIGLSMFSTPFVLGTPAGIDVLAVRIVRLTSFSFPAQLAEAVVLGSVLILLIGSAWIFQTRLLRAARHATIGGKTGGEARVALGRSGRILARGSMLGYLAVTSILPFVALLVVSLQPFWSSNIDVSRWSLGNYQRVLLDNDFTRSAFQHSLGLGVVGATVAMCIAALIVFYVQRNAHSPLARGIDGTTKLPAALSHVIVGLALIATFAGPPFHLGGTLLILFMGYLVLYLPQATITAGSALSQIDASLSEASLMSGASQGRTFRRVAVPLMAPGLVAGWIFVFVLMAGDVTASVMLASSRTPVVGFVMIDLFANSTYPVLAAMGAVISIITSAVVLVALFAPRRRRQVQPALLEGGDEPQGVRLAA
jgi:iron(III) transport system permease protein